MSEITDTLVDRLLAATYQPDKRVDNVSGTSNGSRTLAAAMRAKILSSQRYFLTDDVVEAATELGIQHPDILAAMVPRARLPFSKMYIEWSNFAQLRPQGRTIAEDAIDRVGFCVEQISSPNEFPLFKITGFGIDERINKAMTLATQIIYTLDSQVLNHVPFLMQERSNLARLSGVSKELLDAALLGTTYHRIAQITDDPEMHDYQLEICRKLAGCASYVLSDLFPSYDEILNKPKVILDSFTHIVSDTIKETMGTWRFIISVLALIQSREYTDHVQPLRNHAKRRFVNGKSVPYLQLWRVSLKLPRKVVIRNVVTSVRESLPQPRRTIEGYWRRRRSGNPEALTCNHVDVAETANRYRCVFCKSAFFFTPEHERGSAEIGYVKKDRVVETRD